MTDQESLVAAVRDRFDDDTPRLVYADWLDDQNLPHHARFVRESVADARSGSPSRKRGRWHGRGTRLASMFAPMVQEPNTPAPATLFLHNAAGTGVVYNRGLIEAVSAPLGAWLQIGHEVLRTNPVRYVHVHARGVVLPDLPPVQVVYATHATGLPTLLTLACRGWAVEAPAHPTRPALDWAGVRRFDARVFLECLFPGVRFLVESQQVLRTYPGCRWLADGGRRVESEWPDPVGRPEWVVKRPAA